MAYDLHDDVLFWKLVSYVLVEARLPHLPRLVNHVLGGVMVIYCVGIGKIKVGRDLELQKTLSLPINGANNLNHAHTKKSSFDVTEPEFFFINLSPVCMLCNNHFSCIRNCRVF